MTTFILALALIQPAMPQNPVTDPRPAQRKEKREAPEMIRQIPSIDGTQAVRFAMPEGDVSVYLPDDIAPGDTISGSVFGENIQPGMRTDALNGYTVEILGKKTRVSDAMFTFQVPEDATTLDVVIRDPNGTVEDQQPVKCAPARGSFSDFTSLPYCQSGTGLKISGPFDGDRTNTVATIDGQPAGILTESPRAAVVSGFIDLIGSYPVSVTEQKYRPSEQTFDTRVNALSLMVTLPDQAIPVRRKATIAVDVYGLQGLKDSDYPVSVLLVNDAPKVMKFEGRDPEYVQIEIRPEDVVRGHFVKQVPFSAKKAGEFSVSAHLSHGRL